MTQQTARQVTKYIVVGVATVFGLMTLFAGGRVLLGADPGYVVFRPLLIYNTVMGLGYLAVAALIWRRPMQGRYGAAAIFVLNVLVLAGIAVRYQNEGPVAVDSVRAMMLRTGVWLVILLATLWVAGCHQRNP